MNKHYIKSSSMFHISLDDSLKAYSPYLLNSGRNLS